MEPKKLDLPSILKRLVSGECLRVNSVASSGEHEQSRFGAGYDIEGLKEAINAWVNSARYYAAKV